MTTNRDQYSVTLSGRTFEYHEGEWRVQDNYWTVSDKMTVEVLDYIKSLEDDFLVVTGCIAGVGTVLTEEEALRQINLLDSVQRAWERGLS